MGRWRQSARLSKNGRSRETIQRGRPVLHQTTLALSPIPYQVLGDRNWARLGIFDWLEWMASHQISEPLRTAVREAWFGARRLSAKQVGQDIRLQVALNMYLFLAANVTRTTEVRWWEQGTFFWIDSCHVKVFPTHAFNTAWLQTTTYWIAQQGRRWTQLSSSICKSGGPERIRQSWWSAARGESTLCIASLGPIMSLCDDSGMNDALGSSASYNIYLLGLWFLP